VATAAGRWPNASASWKSSDAVDPRRVSYTGRSSVDLAFLGNSAAIVRSRDDGSEMRTPAPDELVGVSLFSDLSLEQRSIVAGWLEIEEIPTGRVLAEQGAAGYAFYVVRDGVAEVSVDGVPVRNLSVDEFFGEISILFEGRRTATVTASSPMTVWSMFGTRFRELQQGYPDIASAITQAAQSRRDATG
jgi:CRP-like cAMP-binding protein